MTMPNTGTAQAVTDDLEELGPELGLTFRYLTPYQIRIEEVLDIWPKNKKYHDIQRNRRGQYKRLEPFLRSFFAGSENTVPAKQIKCPHCRRFFTPA